MIKQRRSITVSIPVRLLRDIDKLAKKEWRTRNAVMLDALQFYFSLRKDKGLRGALHDRASALQMETEDDIESIVDQIRK